MNTDYKTLKTSSRFFSFTLPSFVMLCWHIITPTKHIDICVTWQNVTKYRSDRSTFWFNLSPCRTRLPHTWYLPMHKPPQGWCGSRPFVCRIRFVSADSPLLIYESAQKDQETFGWKWFSYPLDSQVEMEKWCNSRITACLKDTSSFILLMSRRKQKYRVGLWMEKKTGCVDLKQELYW